MEFARDGILCYLSPTKPLEIMIEFSPAILAIFMGERKPWFLFIEQCTCSPYNVLGPNVILTEISTATSSPRNRSNKSL